MKFVRHPEDARFTLPYTTMMAAFPPFGYVADYLWWWLITLSLLSLTILYIRTTARRPQTTPARRTTRLLIGNLLIVLTLLAFAGTLGETWFRYIDRGTDAYGLTMASRRWLALYPNLNDRDFRDANWTTHPLPGTRRIAFVGDSFTFGWGVRDHSNIFVERIRTQLQQDGHQGYDLMNVSVGGWETGNHIAAAEALINQFNIHDVILCYCMNDISDLTPPHVHRRLPYPPDNAWLSSESSFLLDYLYVNLYVRRSFQSNYFDDLARTYADAETWDLQTFRLQTFANLCRTRGVGFRVALLPMPTYSGTLYNPKTIHQQLRGFLQKEGIPVVDLLPTIDGIDPASLVINSRDYHPNEKAHALFAEAIYNAWFTDGRFGAAPGSSD